jgi:hypothetical protein
MNSGIQKFGSVLFALLGFVSAQAQAPQVAKVEPPSWWVGSSVNPVRVMIRGKDLKGARVQVNAPGCCYFTAGQTGNA